MMIFTAAVVAGSLGFVEPPEAVVERATSSISPEQVLSDLKTLVGFSTRHTMSRTDSDDEGIGAARRWLASEFERYAVNAGRDDVTVELETHTVLADGRRITTDTDVVNVVCTIPGSDPAAKSRLYYVVGHYDSRASGALDAESFAPGANDDGSGTVVCLAVARAIMNERLESTVIIMPVAGEEQGLYGARRHAGLASDEGKDVRAVLSNDIVGDPTGPGGREARGEVRMFSEGIPTAILAQEGRATSAVRMLRSLSAESDSTSRQLARYLREVADMHNLPVKPKLVFRPDRFLRGGDHTGFNEAGFAAVRMTEVYENYDHQHQDVRIEDGKQMGDLVEFIDEGYIADVARLNAAGIVHLANAPSAPTHARIIIAELTNDTTLRWDASPESDVAGYEIVYRDTTSPVWEHSVDVGKATEGTVDLSKDNWFFGVRSYDKDGYQSPVSFPIAARE
jgi:Zn-dependent M28 family amino/carboxypeptidase